MPSRVAIALMSMILGASLLTAAWIIAEPAPEQVLNPALVLFNKTGNSNPFLSVQNFMWIIFFIGLGELYCRWNSGSVELAQLSKNILPEDEQTLLRQEDLGPYYQRLKSDRSSQKFYLQRLLKRIILQFNTSRSIDQANSLMNSSLELYQHEIDLKYNILKYIVWVIPTLGFIGTIIGIALAQLETFQGWTRLIRHQVMPCGSGSKPSPSSSVLLSIPRSLG